jgi:aminomethyltransferase
MNSSEHLHRTRFHELHQQAGAKLVPFAGYEMPVNYSEGIIKEHLHTREKSGLFDVSHMGQVRVSGNNAAQMLEKLMPVDIQALEPGRQRYGLLLNSNGGIIDDLMVSCIAEDNYILVVNAACKENDFNHLKDKIGAGLDLEMLEQRSLLALQGPATPRVLERLGHNLADMAFMSVRELELDGITCLFSRSGYTGEDGFEISVDNARAVDLARVLLADEDVKWVGLGARDSLRLEAGLCLYGHDITAQTTPVEANLLWAISKSRRTGGSRSGGFPGDQVILSQIPKNVSKLLVGLTPEGRAPVREGAVIENLQGNPVGQVTSGGFSPSLGHPICMGYVEIEHCEEHQRLNAVVRGKSIPVVVTRPPFVPRRYYRPA